MKLRDLIRFDIKKEDSNAMGPPIVVFCGAVQLGTQLATRVISSTRVTWVSSLRTRG